MKNITKNTIKMSLLSVVLTSTSMFANTLDMGYSVVNNDNGDNSKIISIDYDKDSIYENLTYKMGLDTSLSDRYYDLKTGVKYKLTNNFYSTANLGYLKSNDKFRTVSSNDILNTITTDNLNKVDATYMNLGFGFNTKLKTVKLDTNVLVGKTLDSDKRTMIKTNLILSYKNISLKYTNNLVKGKKTTNIVNDSFVSTSGDDYETQILGISYKYNF